MNRDLKKKLWTWLRSNILKIFVKFPLDKSWEMCDVHWLLFVYTAQVFNKELLYSLLIYPMQQKWYFYKHYVIVTVVLYSNMH